MADSITSKDIVIKLNKTGMPLSYYKRNELYISASYDTFGHLKMLIYEGDSFTNMVWRNDDLVSLDNRNRFGGTPSKYFFSYDTSRNFVAPFANFTALKGLYNWPFDIFNFQAFSKHILVRTTITGGYSTSGSIKKYDYVFVNNLEQKITKQYSDEYMDKYPENVFEFHIKDR